MIGLSPPTRSGFCYNAKYIEYDKYLISASNRNGVAEGKFLLANADDGNQKVPYTLSLAGGGAPVPAQHQWPSVDVGKERADLPDAHVQAWAGADVKGGDSATCLLSPSRPTLGVRGRTRLAGGACGPGAGAARAYHDKEPGEPGNGEVERKMNLSRGAIWRPPMAVFWPCLGWARVRQWRRSGPYPCLRAVMPIAACRRHAFIEGNACEINPQSHPAQFDAGLVGRAGYARAGWWAASMPRSSTAKIAALCNLATG